MANTTNLNLVKPAGTDKALVSVLNSNSDKIDAWAGSTNQALSNVSDDLQSFGTTVGSLSIKVSNLEKDVVLNTTLKDVSIPDGSLSSYSNIELDFTSIIPSGYNLYGATIAIQSGSSWYTLPWYNNALTQILRVNRIAGKKIYLQNGSTGWGTTNLSASLFLKKSS